MARVPDILRRQWRLWRTPSAQTWVEQFGIVIFVLIMLSVVLLSVILSHQGPWEARSVTIVLAIALLMAIYALRLDEGEEDEGRRLSLRRVGVLGLISVLVLAINALGTELDDTLLPYLFFIVAGHATATLPLRHAILHQAILIGLWSLLMRMIGVDAAQTRLVVISLSLGFLFTSTFTLLAIQSSEQGRRSQRLLEELQESNLALKEAREREKGLAVAAERVRLAREIHDGLGHHLTVLAVQLQAAAQLIERDPARATAAIETCQQVAAAALSEVRHSVASMRESPLDGHSLEEALRTLVDTFGRGAAVSPRLEIEGEPRPLAAPAELTLYRAVQEGLTNVQKHAAARSAEVTLNYADDGATIRVRNDGDARPDSSGGGYGLAGLRERAQQLGGHLHAAPTARGFLLELTLPTELREGGS